MEPKKHSSPKKDKKRKHSDESTENSSEKGAKKHKDDDVHKHSKSSSKDRRNGDKHKSRHKDGHKDKDKHKGSSKRHRDKDAAVAGSHSEPPAKKREYKTDKTDTDSRTDSSKHVKLDTSIHTAPPVPKLNTVLLSQTDLVIPTSMDIESPRSSVAEKAKSQPAINTAVATTVANTTTATNTTTTTTMTAAAEAASCGLVGAVGAATNGNVTVLESVPTATASSNASSGPLSTSQSIVTGKTGFEGAKPLVSASSSIVTRSTGFEGAEPLADPLASVRLSLGPAFNTRSQTDHLFDPKDVMTDELEDSGRLESMRQSMASAPPSMATASTGLGPGTGTGTGPSSSGHPKEIWDPSLVAAPQSASVEAVQKRLWVFMPIEYVSQRSKETVVIKSLRYMVNAVNGIYVRIHELSRGNPNIKFRLPMLIRCNQSGCSDSALCSSPWHERLAGVSTKTIAATEGLPEESKTRQKYVITLEECPDDKQMLTQKCTTISEKTMVADLILVLSQLQTLEGFLLNGARDPSIVKLALDIFDWVAGCHTILSVLAQTCCQHVLEFVANRNEIKIDKNTFEQIRSKQREQQGGQWGFTPLDPRGGFAPLDPPGNGVQHKVSKDSSKWTPFSTGRWDHQDPIPPWTPYLERPWLPQD